MPYICPVDEQAATIVPAASTAIVAINLRLLNFALMNSSVVVFVVSPLPQQSRPRRRHYDTPHWTERRIDER